MLLHPRRSVRQVSRPGIAALAAGLCLLSPAAASARGNAHLESGVSEDSTTAPLQESTPNPPSAADPPTESSTKTPREARRARRDARAGTGCSVKLQATPPTITARAPLSLDGTLSCPEAASAADQTVTLYQKVARTPGFAIAATATTETNGTFQFAPFGLEINSVFYVGAAGATSARTSVKVAPPVTFSGARTSVKVAPLVTLSAPAAGTQLFIGGGRTARASAVGRDAVTFSGTVSPADAGATVTLQREFRREAWHRIGVGQVDGEGNYSIVHTFSRPGEANLRVLVHSHGLYVTSASTPVSYQISRRRSRQVTIQASVDPVAYGSPMTISGTVAGAVNQPVTLLAQTPGGAFAPVAKGVTNGGEYTFTESPLQSTRYRVSSTSASSATLSEGVTYALSATPFASTVQAGEQLTFTGTLAPAHEGQVVDLEGRNASGLGYRVIAVGAVSSLSAYSIAYTFPAAGSELLRIRVPGNTEIQSVASEAFKVEVTPAA